MEFVCYTEFSELPESAVALFEIAEKNNLFFSRAWFENLIANAGDEIRDIQLACVLDKDKLMAMLPLMNCSGKTWNSLKHRYSPLSTLLLADINQQEIIACFIKGMNTLSFEGLLLEPVAEDDPALILLQSNMEASGFICERQFRFYNWALNVQGKTYQAYMQDRPARLRNTIARKTRKLAREHDYEIRLYRGDDVAKKMPDYYAVIVASWKASEQYSSLMDGMVASFSKQDWTRLAVLYINKQPAAAQLWFVANRKASIFRLAYDENWKQYSPGSILTSYLMQVMIDNEQVTEIDFLIGNESYKQDWMSGRRERYVLSCIKKNKPEINSGLLANVFKRIFK